MRICCGACRCSQNEHSLPSAPIEPEGVGGIRTTHVTPHLNKRCLAPLTADVMGAWALLNLGTLSLGPLLCCLSSVLSWPPKGPGFLSDAVCFQLRIVTSTLLVLIDRLLNKCPRTVDSNYGAGQSLSVAFVNTVFSEHSHTCWLLAALSLAVPQRRE